VLGDLTVSGGDIELTGNNSEFFFNGNRDAKIQFDSDASKITLETPEKFIIAAGGNNVATVSTSGMTIVGFTDSTSYKVGGVAGASGSFTTSDSKTVTVTNGIITAITGP